MISPEEFEKMRLDAIWRFFIETNWLTEDQKLEIIKSLEKKRLEKLNNQGIVPAGGK